MATCQDLVNAVNAMGETHASILAELQEIKAKEGEVLDALNLLVRVMNDRLPNRAMWDLFFLQLTEAVLYNGDIVAERLAQANQMQSQMSDVALSNVGDLTPLDTSVDINTPGVL